MPQLFAIIVHYGPSAPTLQAIAHLMAGSVQPAHLLVIDHAATPFTYDFQGRGQVIRPSHNAGYAAGVNIGLGALASRNAALDDLVIAMNNDVLVKTDTLAAIQEWRTTHLREVVAGVVAEEGPSLVYGGGRVHKWTGKAILNIAPGHPLDYVHGAFLVAPYAVFLRVQGLPEYFFLYWEDVAFSYVLRRRNIPLEVITTARVVHHTTPAVTDTHLYYLVRNGALFLEQHLTWPWRLYWRLRNMARRHYHRARTHTPERLAIQQGLRDARQRRTGARPLASATSHAL